MHAENAKNQAAARVRYYAKLNWRIHADKAEQYFLATCATARAEGFFEFLYTSRDDERRQVQMFAGQHPIGDIAIKRDLKGREVGRELAPEHGAAIVISQAITGAVAVILYPYESAAAKRTERYIVWKILDDPTEVTSALLSRATADFLVYLRVSSSLFAESRRDRARIRYLELRSRKYMGSGGLAKYVFSNWFLPALGAVGSAASIYSLFPRK
jgi:hypothetical protein